MAKLSEEQLAQTVIAWLEDMRWDVYQEVQTRSTPGRADIVAIQNCIVWVIESKISLGLSVLEQADKWYPYAHYRSVATPHGASHFIYEICQWRGIGVIVRQGESFCHEQIEPSLNRKAYVKWTEALSSEHKTYAKAGTATGRFWSPFKLTCQKIVQYVSGHEGCDLKELMAGIQHHYTSSATARQMIPHWILAGKVPGVEASKDGKRWKFYTQRDRML